VRKILDPKDCYHPTCPGRTCIGSSTQVLHAWHRSKPPPSRCSPGITIVYKTMISSFLLFLLVPSSSVAVAQQRQQQGQQQQRPLVAFSPGHHHHHHIEYISNHNNDADDIENSPSTTAATTMPHLQMAALATTKTMTTAALLLGSLSSPVLAAGATAAVDLNWYPPSSTQINNLTAALDPRSGTYGFVYNTSSPASGTAPYGTYNWCNMPHVRKAEYVVPGAGNRTAGEWTLKYVEVVSFVALFLSLARALSLYLSFLASLPLAPSYFRYTHLTIPESFILNKHAEVDLVL